MHADYNYYRHYVSSLFSKCSRVKGNFEHSLYSVHSVFQILKISVHQLLDISKVS